MMTASTLEAYLGLGLRNSIPLMENQHGNNMNTEMELTTWGFIGTVADIVVLDSW